jgi:hypothetical protein
LDAHQDNRSRVVDALLFWKDLAIFYDGCWYQTGGDHVERDFPPPVRHFDVKKGRTITVTLDPAWVKLALEKKFFAAIPLPLPSDASAQNLVLRVLTSMPTLVGEDREHLNCSALIQRHILCRRIGLRHEEKKLERIGAIVAGWFEARAGKFWLQEDRCGRVAFAFTPPAVPRSKTARTKGQSRPKQHARRGK